MHLTVRINVPSELLCVRQVFSVLRDFYKRDTEQSSSSTLEAVRPREMGRGKRENVETGWIGRREFCTVNLHKVVPQVARRPQASCGRSGEQQQEQNSPTPGTAL